MHIKLARGKQRVDGEAEHNKKKMKMAGARKPEEFVWLDNEVELLLRLTLGYKERKLQETRTQARSPPLLLLLLLLWDVAEFRGRGVEWWRHRCRKYADSPSTRRCEGRVFRFFHPETWFQKSAFTGSMWTISQNDAKRVFTHKSVSMWTASMLVS